MPNTHFADKTADKKCGGIVFFESVHIELVKQLSQMSSNAMKKRFQKTEMLKISTVSSIVTVISTRDCSALFKFRCRKFPWVLPFISSVSVHMSENYRFLEIKAKALGFA
ncbi:hypothetical protein Y032_0193g1390 [Ancylostoma ceylanicum]|uniref:Uncharacterized protein n=1 Tax=Ancylostoma ceylanicum TaxID=53326 RepID=A0A016SQ88_9BILA|nr:hypothetical protein Y032_0193g1390 [Ancylostoma ceylanicum]